MRYFPPRHKLSAVVTPLVPPCDFVVNICHILPVGQAHTYLRRNMRYLQNPIYSQIRMPKYTTEPDWNSIFCSLWPVRGLEISDSTRRKSTFPTPTKSGVSTSDWNNRNGPKSKNRIPNIIREYKLKSCNPTSIKQRVRPI